MSDEIVANGENGPPFIGAASANWFYIDKGTRKGPVSIAMIEKLLKEKSIDADTQVWRSGQKDWSSLRNSELTAFMGTEPPPVSGDHVSNSLVWIVALLPLALALFEGYLRDLPNTVFIDDFQRTLIHLFPEREVPWWLVAFFNSILCAWDRQLVSRAGYSSGWMTIFALFMVPVYLFVRAKKLKQWPTYAATWVVLTAAQIILFLPMHI